MKHVIIGGVAGGATAAARIRRVDESAEIIILEKGPNISYANCGLPYYIGRKIGERKQLLLQTPQSFHARYNVDVRVESEAVAIDPANKTVTVQQNNGEQYLLNYDKLLLSPGAKPVIPPLPGVNKGAIFTMRNVDDTDKIFDFTSTHTVDHAVVIGAGFIGLEMVENLHAIGAEVALVEMCNQVMPAVDYSMAAHIQKHLESKEVQLYLEHQVTEFVHHGEKIEVILKSGKSIMTDMVILSVGVRPEVELAKNANIKIGETGGIWVDEYLQTSIEDIYAIGDAIEYPHPITGKPWMNFLANPANRQGRLVADNMVLGNSYGYEGAIGTAIAKVFDMTIATTGLTAKRLQQEGIPYMSSYTHTAAHATYYPGGKPISTKLIFCPESGAILGAQCVGAMGVDKRIDQIALLIKTQGSIYDLMEVEHAYAPPFSSAKDPIAIAGYVAENMKSGIMPVVRWRDVRDRDIEKVFMLDVRTAEEVKNGIIEGAVNIPVDALRERLSEIPTDKEIYVTCAVGLRGYLATKILMANGIKNVKNLSGGMKTYEVVAPIVKP